MNDSKNQIIDKLRNANSILVTVSENPSVDQLSACIALTMLLNKFKKNTTAVFSGKVPSVIEFLHPSDTIQASTDSLRDFIIAIDKSKADKLRYKLEDDVVKIFITPYKTSISPDDLQYSAGDFNVDVIIALGVQHQQDLDHAITAHGRIFHDAVTLAINNQPGGDLGIVNWEDLEASSLSELVADLLNSLDPNLLDADIATAILTGIVAETSRFSNDKTHPRTLNVSSTLLAAGADQQLVNSKLQDLIGVVVNLKAGDQVAPTVTEPEQSSHADVTEELIIDKNGSLQPVIDESAADVLPDTMPGNQIETPPEAQEETMPEAALEPVGLQQTEEPAPESVAATVPDSDGAQAQFDVVPPAVPDLVNYPEPPISPVYATTQTLVADAQYAPEPQQNPLITSIEPHQPSYANPATMTQYDGPAPIVTVPDTISQAQPTNEPAPLSMSPADQAFTMPMPPPSAAAPPVFPPPPRQEAPVDTPPPLPPPLMPMS